MGVRFSGLLVAGLLLAFECHADLVEVVAKAKPSLVAVGTFSAMDNPRVGFRGTGFAVADGRRMTFDLHSVSPFQAPDDRVQMLVVDAPEANFVVGVVMLDDQAGVLFHQALKSAG